MLLRKTLQKRKHLCARLKTSPMPLHTQLRYINPRRLTLALLILYIIQWARAEFDNMFVKPAQSCNAYLSEPNYLENNLKFSGQQIEQIEQLTSFLVTNKPITFEECIVWARLQFEEKYNNSIRQLLFSLPKDALTKESHLFWSGPKRAPDPLIFNSSDVRQLSLFKLTAAEISSINSPRI